MTRDRANAGPIPDPCSFFSYWQTNDSLSWPASSSQEMFCSKFLGRAKVGPGVGLGQK